MIRSLEGLFHLLEAILANIWFGFPGRSLVVIGVTGTDGKTTTTTLIYEILKKAGCKASMISSVHAVVAGKSYDTGFHVTTPRAWHIQQYLHEAVKHGDTHMVLEVTSHALSQYRVWGVPFAVGVLTNVTHEHLDWHGTYEAYLKTKVSLLLQSKKAVYCADVADIARRVSERIGKEGQLTFGLSKQADVTPRAFSFKTSLPGEFNTLNCLAAIAATKAIEIADGPIRAATQAFRGVPGRMEIVARAPYMVIIDFAHTPNAFSQVLPTVRALTKKRLIHVFGTAAERDRAKRPMMGRISAKFADITVLTEEDYRKENIETIMDEIARGIPKKHPTHRFPDRKEAIGFAFSIAAPGDTVLITGKGHEKSLARGGKEYPWSDQEAVEKLLDNN